MISRAGSADDGSSIMSVDHFLELVVGNPRYTPENNEKGIGMAWISRPRCSFDEGLHGLLSKGSKELGITAFGKTEEKEATLVAISPFARKQQRDKRLRVDVKRWSIVAARKYRECSHCIIANFVVGITDCLDESFDLSC
jgi:hypothetical protein